MKQFFVILVVLAAGLSGVGAAQELPTNSTATATPEPDGEDTYVVAIDPITRVVSWDYSNGKFTILVEADAPQLLTISESPDVQEGAGTFNVRRTNLPRGRTEIEISAGKDAGAAVVSMTTSQCINSGTCPYLSTGERSGPSPFERTSSTAGWMGGVGISVILFGLAAYRVKNSEPDEPEDLV